VSLGIVIKGPSGLVLAADSRITLTASIAITLDTYSHVIPTMQRQAAAAMDPILSS
jgi:hypothetical protein